MFRNQAEQVRDTVPGFDDLVAAAMADLATPESPFEKRAEAPSRAAFAEAIVLARLRPAYFLHETDIDLADAEEGQPDLVALVDSNRAMLAATCRGVGRIDLVHHINRTSAGTGFLIDDALVLTNRHVALLFAERLWHGGYRALRGRDGEDVEARMDYRRYHNADDRLRADVEEVLYIAKDHEPDFALLRVAPQAGAAKLHLLGAAAGPIAPRTPVAVVGYPATDGTRNDPATMDRIFRGVYDVKRLAPGFVSDRMDGDVIFLSDYSSLGGNSGSPVIRLDTGKVAGLHFAGEFLQNNYAVAADVIESARREVIRTHPAVAVPTEAPTTKPVKLEGRNGYDPDFLGPGALSVPMPGPGTWKGDVAPVDGAADGVLRYRNFATVQSASRRLPLLTAVNIDGSQAVVLKRKGTWRLDGRLKAEHQIGNDLYAANAFDRGHLVRRRDPGWGPHAQEAELDTFHYTNSAPQHEALNQKDWVGLEDYILQAAETRGFRVTVFTGPVFRDSDPRLRKAPPDARDIRIPEEFWKVAVMVNAATGGLSATGYVLSQGRMIRRLVEAPFVYGSYLTYQVKVALIAQETGLDFGTLPQADPLGAKLTESAAFDDEAHVVAGPDSLILGPAPLA